MFGKRRPGVRSMTLGPRRHPSGATAAAPDNLAAIAGVAIEEAFENQEWSGKVKTFLPSGKRPPWSDREGKVLRCVGCSRRRGHTTQLTEDCAGLASPCAFPRRFGGGTRTGLSTSIPQTRRGGSTRPSGAGWTFQEGRPRRNARMGSGGAGGSGAECASKTHTDPPPTIRLCSRGESWAVTAPISARTVVVRQRPLARPRRLQRDPVSARLDPIAPLSRLRARYPEADPRACARSTGTRHLVATPSQTARSPAFMPSRRCPPRA